ncbi:OmpH family outer membrane protein [Calditrichota bacterium]
MSLKRIYFLTVPIMFVTILIVTGCAGTGVQPGVQSEGSSSAEPVDKQMVKSPSGSILPWSTGNLRIGYIRSDMISKELTAYKDADVQLKSENRKWLEEAEEMESNIKKLEAERDELGIILSAERMKEIEKRISDARKEVQNFKQKTWYDESSTYIKRRKELMEPIDKRVNEAIYKVAEDADMDMILDTVAGNIVFVKPEFDLTERVMQELEE